MKKELYPLFKYPLVWFVFFWLATLIGTTSIADRLITYRPSFPYSDTRLAATGLPKMIYSWANFDGVHYLTIAKDGYLSTALVQAFFPVFPFILSLSNILLLPTVVFGLIFNIVCVVVFFYLWHKLYRAESIPPAISFYSMVSLLSFPTSFFLISLYTESFFLVLTVAVFLAAKQKKWLVASCCIGIASATRLIGIFLVPAVILYILQDSGILESKNISARSLLTSILAQTRPILTVLLLGSAGLVSYMYFLNTHFSDPLYFFHVQAEFGGGRQESIVLLPQVLYRYVSILLTYRPFNIVYYASLQELMSSIIIGFSLLLAWRKKLAPIPQLLFSLACIILPTFTGTLSSMPRYVLVALPAFTAIGWLLQRFPKFAPWWIGFSTFFLVFNTILFIQGYWVA